MYHDINIYIYYYYIIIIIIIIIINRYKMFIGGGDGRCMQSNHQKIHFSLHPGHSCYSENERLD